MKLDRLSIKWKLFFYIAVFAAIMLAVLWLFQIVFLDSFYKYIKTGQIKSAAHAFARDASGGDIYNRVLRQAQQGDMCVIVLDEAGQVISDAHILPSCMIHRLPGEALTQWTKMAADNGGDYLETFSPGRFFFGIFKDEWLEDVFQLRFRTPPEGLLYIKHITSPEGQPLALLLNSQISPVDATVETLRIQLFYVTGIFIVLAFGVAWFISRKIARPVIQINQSAQKLAAGEYDVHFDGRGYREIVQLSETLNTAAYELSRVESLRRELIANVSHDLRTPLTMITGFAELMRDIPRENTPQNAQIIIDEANRLTRLVFDLLDLSKLQSEAFEMTPARFNLTQSVRAMIGRFSKLSERENEIVFKADTDVHVSADELQISQVIYNLIANAVTHADKATRVEVTQRREGGMVRIEVADHGPGIPKEELPYIWERYYKVDKTHKRAHYGTGLGLAIVKGVLERHNARYGVESVEGSGTSFWFCLPIE